MSALIERRIAALDLKTCVELTYGDSLSVTGSITDKDASDIAITTDTGEEFIINSASVLSLKILAPHSSRNVPSGQGTFPSNGSVSKASVNEPFFFHTTITKKLPYTDAGLKEILNRLPSDLKKEVNGFCASFFYGIQNNDRDKALRAARQLENRIKQEQIDNCDCLYLAALMLARCDKYNISLFLQCKAYGEAALISFKEEDVPDLLQAGVYSALALYTGRADGLEDELFSLLSNACVQENDVSLVLWLNSGVGSISQKHLQEAVRWLLEQKGFSLQEVQKLDEIYPAKNLVQKAKNLLGANESEDSSETPAEDEDKKTPEQKVDDRSYGELLSIRWVNETGKVSAGASESGLDFKYSDVTDPKLLKIILEIHSSGEVQQFIPVRFRQIGERAVALALDSEQEVQSFLQAGHAISTNPKIEDRYTKALALLKKALVVEPNRGYVLSEIIRISIAKFKADKESDRETDVLSDAEQLYQENVASYPMDWQRLELLSNLYRAMNNEAKSIRLLEQSLSCNDIPPRAHLSELALYLKILRDRYAQTEREDDLKAMRSACRQWENLFLRTPELADQHNSNLYYSQILPELAYTEILLGQFGEAEKHLKIAATQCPEGERLKTVHALLGEKQPEAVAAADEDELQTEPIERTAAPEEKIVPAEPKEPELENIAADYIDHEGWDALGIKKETAIDRALHLGTANGVAPLVAYLKAGALLNPEINSVYTVVALATDSPLEQQDYSAESLLREIEKNDGDYSILNSFCMAAACLRSAFGAKSSYEYTLKTLHDSIVVFTEIPQLETVFHTLAAFRSNNGAPIDLYADYRNLDADRLASQMKSLIANSQQLYAQFFETPPRETSSLLRLLETKKLVFQKGGMLESLLCAVKEQNASYLEHSRAEFERCYIAGGKAVAAESINLDAVDALIEACWKSASEKLNTSHRNLKLQGNRRNNLRSNIQAILSEICKWYQLADYGCSSTERTESAAQMAYTAVRDTLRQQLATLSFYCEMPRSDADPQYPVGLFLLGATAKELENKIDGSWDENSRRFFFAEFLHSDNVTLNEVDFLPDLSSSFCALPDFNILSRIQNHMKTRTESLEEHLTRIYHGRGSNNNYGTAKLIRQCLLARSEKEIKPIENEEKFVAQTRRFCGFELQRFHENYALAASRGQIVVSDTFLTELEDTADVWYAVCCASGNYGMFSAFVKNCYDKISLAAADYENTLSVQMDSLVAQNSMYFGAHPQAEQEIRLQISQQNFTVAEDWCNRVQRGEVDFFGKIEAADAIHTLRDFWEGFAVDYGLMSNAGDSVRNLVTQRTAHRKDSRGAQLLVSNWPRSGLGSTSSQITDLLALLGWQNCTVTSISLPARPRLELYHVELPKRTGRAIYAHPIAAFGTSSAKQGFGVVCLYGYHDADRLLAVYRELEQLNQNIVVLLDYALPGPERRKLARKIKEKENGISKVYLLMDRVALQYLAKNSSDTSNMNRMLLAIGMPFSYFQPFVANSATSMPPEMFIGRKDDLLKVESRDGVNLIYGGRQLGKSALFKKARSDLDGIQGNRAILVDLSDCDCMAAARKISSELVDLGILSAGAETEDWDELVRSIKQRLRSAEQPTIHYFLLMLDEADVFIESCEAVNFKPFVALKDLQQTQEGQFKFVLAGLHNIVRFKREVALGNNAVITHLDSIKITPFRSDEAMELLTQPLSYLGFSLEDSALASQILASCNYFPGLIQTYCTKLIEAMRLGNYGGYSETETPPYVVTETHIKKLLADKDFRKQIQNKFEITLRLDSGYYSIALLMAWMEANYPSENGYSAQQLSEQARSFDLKPLTALSVEQVNALMLELEELNILRNTEDTFSFSSKNFRDLLGTPAKIEESILSIGGR